MLITTNSVLSGVQCAHVGPFGPSLVADGRLLPHSTHCYARRQVDLTHRRRTEGSPRVLRGFGSCER